MGAGSEVHQFSRVTESCEQSTYDHHRITHPPPFSGAFSKSVAPNCGSPVKLPKTMPFMHNH